MKKILGIIASLLVAASVQANTYSATDSDITLLTKNDPTYTGTFDLTSDGYNPTTETITSASAVFSFAGAPGLDSFNITMDADSISQSSFFLFTTVSADLNDVSDNLSAWGSLDSTGILSYTVTLTADSKFESLIVGPACLTADTTSRSVPDGGATALLLGLGVIGIIGAKRRFASVA